MNRVMTNFFGFQEHGNQRARTPATLLTKHQSVVLRSQHFTVLPSPHAPSVLVAVDQQNRIQQHASGLLSWPTSLRVMHAAESFSALALYDLIHALSTFLCMFNREGEPEPVSQSNSLVNPEIVRCTDHMCPLRVHWHFKNNYRDHWKVKLTVSNYNYNRNYSDWNVLVQHPGFSQPALIYSFNSTVLPTVGIPGTCIIATLHVKKTYSWY